MKIYTYKDYSDILAKLSKDPELKLWVSANGKDYILCNELPLFQNFTYIVSKEDPVRQIRHIGPYTYPTPLNDLNYCGIVWSAITCTSFYFSESFAMEMKLGFLHDCEEKAKMHHAALLRFAKLQRKT